MIPRANILQWRSQAPWPLEAQVEQDLVLSRLIVELFSNHFLCGELAFRGGTALHKIFLENALRHSEDIDLVMINPGAIGNVIDAIRGIIDPWLGTPKRTRSEKRVRLIYKFNSESLPVTNIRVKIEINTMEKSAFLGFYKKHYSVSNPWFSGSAEVTTYKLEELLGTKLRALYQRKKGRDLFDIGLITRLIPQINLDQVVECFQLYTNNEGIKISRAEFEANLAQKINDPAFKEDVMPLLPPNVRSDYEISKEVDDLRRNYIEKLSGDPWRGNNNPRSGSLT